MANEQQQVTQIAAVQEGGRWLWNAPKGEDVAAWFRQQRLHPALEDEHDRYISGVVLIGAQEKVKITRERNGQAFIADVERPVFVPYVKVDTRIAYFWDLCRAMDAIGVIEPVPQRRIEDVRSGYFNMNLPEGFFVMPVRNNTSQESYNRYLGCTFRVAIYERESYARKVAGHQDVPIISGIGSKQTPLAKQYADDNALMKAETGAIGRALGVAGMLVVGSGVATAEDMMESQANAAAPVGAAAGPEATLPPVSAPSGGAAAQAPQGAEAPGGDGGGVQQTTTAAEQDEELRERARAIKSELESDFPDVWTAILAWWQERNMPPLAELRGPQLRGVVVKLERDLDTAKQGEEK